MRLRIRSLTEMRTLAEVIAGFLRAGDLLILAGNLGAGKTTFTQSLGAGLGVGGRIASPTFVIAREHPSLHGGPALVHVDAYRLGAAEELSDLDLDSELEESITVVEWGEGLAEQLSQDYLSLTITHSGGADVEDFDDEDPADDEYLVDEERLVDLTGHGERWAERLGALTAAIAERLPGAEEPGAEESGPADLAAPEPSEEDG